MRVGEIDARLADIDVQAVLLHRTQKGHFDVDIVLVESVVDELGLPLGHFRLGDDFSGVFEFGRRAERDAGDLADPAGRHFVAILLDRQPPEFRFRRMADDGSEGHKTHQNRPEQCKSNSHGILLRR